MTVVGHPNRVLEVGIASVGHLNRLSVYRCYLRPWRIYEVLDKGCKLRRGWPLKLAFSGGGQTKGNSQKGISNKHIVESEWFFFSFLNAEALFSFWQLFVFIVFV